MKPKQLATLIILLISIVFSIYLILEATLLYDINNDIKSDIYITNSASQSDKLWVLILVNSTIPLDKVIYDVYVDDPINSAYVNISIYGYDSVFDPKFPKNPEPNHSHFSYTEVPDGYLPVLYLVTLNTYGLNGFWLDDLKFKVRVINDGQDITLKNTINFVNNTEYDTALDKVRKYVS